MSTLEKKYFDEAAPAKALEGVMPLVEEMCAHLVAEKKRELASIAQDYRHLPPVYYQESGWEGTRGNRILAVTKDDFERLLSPWKQAMGKHMLRYPRSDGEPVDDVPPHEGEMYDGWIARVPRKEGTRESIADYHKRLRSSGDNWHNRFERMGVWLGHIARIDDEKRAAAQREAAQRKREEHELAERKRAERRALERQATVDDTEVKRLRAIIEEAREVEELMAILERAKDARHALLGMYTNEREACEALGKPVPERSVPGWPRAFDPPTIVRS